MPTLHFNLSSNRVSGVDHRSPALPGYCEPLEVTALGDLPFTEGPIDEFVSHQLSAIATELQELLGSSFSLDAVDSKVKPWLSRHIPLQFVASERRGHLLVLSVKRDNLALYSVSVFFGIGDQIHASADATDVSAGKAIAAIFNRAYS